MQGALGTFSVCTRHAWDVNDKGEQSFLRRHGVIKPRSQGSSHALMLEKEGSCWYREAPAVTGDKLVTHQAAVGQSPHPGWHMGLVTQCVAAGPRAQAGQQLHCTGAALGCREIQPACQSRGVCPQLHRPTPLPCLCPDAEAEQHILYKDTSWQWK